MYVTSVFFHDRAYKVSFRMNIFIYLHSKSVQGYTRLIDDLQYALARNYSHVRGSLGDGLCSCRTVCQQPHVTHLPLNEVFGNRTHLHQFVVSAYQHCNRYTWKLTRLYYLKAQNRTRCFLDWQPVHTTLEYMWRHSSLVWISSVIGMDQTPIIQSRRDPIDRRNAAERHRAQW